MSDDVLAEFDAAVADAERTDAEAGAAGGGGPWRRGTQDGLDHAPNLGLLRALLAGPIADNASTQSGRLAKAFDAWLAYELRRAAFDPSEVWPRNAAPRVWSKELDAVAPRVAALEAWVARQDAAADAAARRLEDRGDAEAVAQAEQRLARERARLDRAHGKRIAKHAQKAAEAAANGDPPPDAPAPPPPPGRVPVQHALMPGLRAAVNAVAAAMPTTNATNVLGRFYVKQVDVVVSSWDRGPDVLISGKTMFSSFGKNTKNRYEETLGEATNLRDRYPLAAMGYAFLVSNDIFGERGAYGRLQDLLVRTRRPYGPYDATMLLIADWDPAAGALALHDPLTHPDPAVSRQQPPVDLSAARFFADLIGAVLTNTPVGVHQEVRDLRNGTAVPGGAPDAQSDASDAADGTA